jgi:hypothetical protein
VRSQFRLPFVALLTGVLIAVLAPATAQANVEIEKFVGINCSEGHETCGEKPTGKDDIFGEPLTETSKPSKTESEEEGYTQAAGHVPYGVTDFMLRHTGSYAEGTAIPTGVVTHVRVDVAAGLAASPAAVPKCSVAEFTGAEASPGSGFFTEPTCKQGTGPHKTGPESTVIGEESATVYFAPLKKDVVLKGQLFNLVPPGPPHARSALYGAALAIPLALTGGAHLYAHTFVEGNVEWGQEAKGTGVGDYHDYFEVTVSPSLPLIRSRQLNYGTAGNGAFITNATSCPGHHTTRLSLEGVNIGEEAEVKEHLEKGEIKTTQAEYETEIALNGCERVPFSPVFSLSPGTSASDQPDQVTTELSVPHFPEKEIDSSQLKTASITLPEGMTLNPSAANGLEACTVGQARIHSEKFGVECPAGSELGSVSLEVPTLSEPLTGKIYLGDPVPGPGESETGPITGPPYILYVVANSERYGVSVRLKGEATPNPVTGQLTTVFKENPEQPFTKLTLSFNRGALTSIANPLLCGTATGSTILTPVAAGVANAYPGFGVSITGCATSIPFAPTQSTSNQTAVPAANTSFVFNLVRPEGQQYLSKVSTTLPEGLAGKIPDAEQCSEAAANSEEVKPQEPKCPEGSKIGTVVVEAGSGGVPYTFPGSVYLTGPYNGAPYGMSIKVPAIAGPFNLGTQVTRATINTNPYTGRVTVASTLPTIRGGVPLRVRRISVDVNKQGFLVNPTSCNALSTESTLTGITTLAPGGATTTATASSPFQLANCSSLGYTPKFVAKTGAKTSKANGASLETTLNFTVGQSNTKSVLVTLPKALPSRLTTLQKACLAATFEANPYACPSGSFVGSARANTPLLPGKLQGPAILVSHGGEAFPDLELVLEANGVRVILDGKTNIKKGITTTDFKTTPDEPVSSVTVVLPTGPHSALTTERLTTNLCTTKLVMPTTITAQNGKVFKQNTIIQPTACPVQIVGHKVVGNTAYVTVKTFAAGRISGSGKGLSTTYRHLTSAKNAVSLKIPLSSAGRRKGRPFKVKLRVGFVPKKKGANPASYNSASTVTVSFRG